MVISNAEILRHYASVFKVVTRPQIQNELGFTQQETAEALQTLLRKKIVKRVDHAVYQWLPKSSGNQVSVDDKIWNVMRILPIFSAADIAYRAGCSEGAAYQRIQQYITMGFLKNKGKRTGAGNKGGRGVRLWGLYRAGRELIHRPTISDVEPDPLMQLTIRLNRLACTGKLRQEAKIWDSAMKLAGEILEELEQVSAGKEIWQWELGNVQ